MIPHPSEPCEDPPINDSNPLLPPPPTELPLVPITYDSVTGPKTKQQRKRQRTNKPRAKTDCRPARSHGTQFKCQALTALAVCSSLSLQSHYCLHGSAINPDTGKVAKYWELLQSSTSQLWSAAKSYEIGRLFQGMGCTSPTPTGTNCCVFIPNT